MSTKVFLITPCFNAAETIQRTLISVATQVGEAELYHHVQDGGSADGTLDILQNWADLLKTEDAATFGRKIHFSFASEPDAGMYDAIAKGFARFDVEAHDWMSWINADDALAIGTLGLLVAIDRDADGDDVEWIAGTTAIVNRDTVVTAPEKPLLCAEVIREGLCDGVHWKHVQQEGTFFRNALWCRIDKDRDFAGFKLAGDWNLWRRFAESAALHQVHRPLGYFHKTEGQLSDLRRDDYAAEMNAVVSKEARRHRLAELAGTALETQELALDPETSALKFSSNSLAMHLKYRLQTLFGEQKAKVLEHTAKQAETPAQKRSTIETIIARKQTRATKQAAVRLQGQRGVAIHAYDDEWQYPAITEKHAFEQAKQLLPDAPGVCYLAFPWATLIDRYSAGGDLAGSLTKQLKDMRVYDGGHDRIITVCQHIRMLEFPEVLEWAGVTDVFWSHATKDQAEVKLKHGTVRIRPFPLYPVQAIDLEDKDDAERRQLFSFIGARNNEWYLTQSREWIIDGLKDDRRGVVAGRDEWHYQKIVYDVQVHGRVEAPDIGVDEDAGRTFRDLLQDSVFSLCPSGSGPNSIRLWESIGAGTVPVILSDTYLVPGDQAVWDQAAVFCPETPEDIRALPDRLEAIASSGELDAKRSHLDQLWLLYGPGNFVYDIHKLFVELATAGEAGHADSDLILKVAERIEAGEYLRADEYDDFLSLCRSRLSLDVEAFLELARSESTFQHALWKAVDKAGNQSRARKVKTVLSNAGIRRLSDKAGSGRTGSDYGRKPRIAGFGRHSNRTPTAYPAYRRLFAKAFDYADSPEEADILVTGFDTDILSAPSDVAALIEARPERQVCVISEEPLWDTVWAKTLTETRAAAGEGPQRFFYDVANHTNSDIFKFDRLPYFITTEDHYFTRYASLFRRNSEFTPDRLLTHWKEAPITAAFYVEKRDDDRFDFEMPALGMEGLCSFRSRVAEGTDRGRVVRVGKGWREDAGPRQALPDWHLDKLAALDRKAFLVSAMENTHHPDYITEKVFDAFAIVGIPIYYASPEHRLYEVCAGGGFINLHGMTETDAVVHLGAFEPDIAFASAYLETQKHLARLFSDPATLLQERNRLVSQVIEHITSVVYAG